MKHELIATLNIVRVGDGGHVELEHFLFAATANFAELGIDLQKAPAVQIHRSDADWRPFVDYLEVTRAFFQMIQVLHALGDIVRDKSDHRVRDSFGSESVVILPSPKLTCSCRHDHQTLSVACVLDLMEVGVELITEIRVDKVAERLLLQLFYRVAQELSGQRIYR